MVHGGIVQARKQSGCVWQEEKRARSLTRTHASSAAGARWWCSVPRLPCAHVRTTGVWSQHQLVRGVHFSACGQVCACARPPDARTHARAHAHVHTTRDLTAQRSMAAQHGMAWRNVPWSRTGTIWRAAARRGVMAAIRRHTICRGTARHGTARHGMVQHNTSLNGTA